VKTIARIGLVVAASFLFMLHPQSGQAQARHRAELVFVANQSSNDLSVYQIKPNGNLAALPGSPFAAGGAPNSVAVTPSGRFAYVADVIPGNITAYSIDQNSALASVPGSPFAAETGTAFVTVNPSGTFLYALNCGALCSASGAGDVQAFTIDQNTGALTPIPGSPFLAGSNPFALAIDSTGHFAYSANFGSNDVSAFSIDNQTGALTQVGLPAPTGGTLPLSIIVDPWGQFVYTANTGSSNVSAFAINFDGSLQPVAGSPFSAGDFTSGVAASTNGKFLIVSAGAGAFVYGIGDTGALTLQVGSPVAAGLGPNGVSIDPTDDFVYIVNAGDSNVSAFRFNENNGNLTPTPKSPFPAGSFAAGITSAPVPTHQ
jgi:6-phosphogluconolactonase (cycloisomerase 2 family)